MESFYFVGIGIMAKIHLGFFAWFDINHISQLSVLVSSHPNCLRCYKIYSPKYHLNFGKLWVNIM